MTGPKLDPEADYMASEYFETIKCQMLASGCEIIEGPKVAYNNARHGTFKIGESIVEIGVWFKGGNRGPGIYALARNPEDSFGRVQPPGSEFYWELSRINIVEHLIKEFA